ncbi:hypothetical protein [Arthrobacter sp. NPDC092385]|uniref:hypothetical protein n=1 Tax=Arthrobacter sp. NPDC092385 TaxID=3363943 RepID=UPI003805A94A
MEPAPVRDFLRAASPLLMIGGIYVLAQSTGPSGRGTVRTADLTVRSLRSYVPVKLAAFAGVLVVAGAVAIALTAGLPAVEADGIADGTGRVPPGRIPGSYFALVAGTSHLLFVLGVVLALVVVVRRRRVPTLTHVEDSIVRRVFINRLLRTTALVSVSGIGSSLEFAAGSGSEQVWSSLRLALAVLWFVTVMVILAAAPPREAEPVDQPVTTGLAAPGGSIERADAVVLGGRRIGYAAWTICLVPLLLASEALGTVLGLSLLALGFLGFCGAQVFAELALTRNHGTDRRLSRSHARQVAPLKPWSLVPAVLLLLVAVIAAAWVVGLLRGSPGAAAWLVAFAVPAVMVMAASIAVARPPVRGALREQDIALRVGTVRRMLLMACSAMCASTGLLLAGNRPEVFAAGPGGLPVDQGYVDTLVVALLVSAVAVAILPAPRGSALPVGTADAYR